jgi:hypothetical protein
MVLPDFQSMRVSEEPVSIYLFRQNPVFTSLHLRSPVQVVLPKDSIMPWAVKSSFKTGVQIQYRSLSLEINHLDSHNAFDKNRFVRIKETF